MRLWSACMDSPSNGRPVGARRRFAPIAHAFLDQARLVEQFIAVEDVFLVETAAVLAKQKPHALLAGKAAPTRRALGVLALLHEGAQARHDRRIDQRRLALPPVLPRKEAVPFAKAGARRRGEVVAVDAGEREIADRDLVRVPGICARMATAVAERVELLDIADGDAGLFGDPGAEADFKSAVIDGIEGTGRQRRAAAPRRPARHENERRVSAHCDDGGGQADLDGHMRMESLFHDAAIPSNRLHPENLALETLRPAADRIDGRDHATLA